MESAALVQVAHGLLDESHVLFGTIVADDDSSMRAQMKWSNADWMVNNSTVDPPRILTKGGKATIRPDKGLLRREYPEPTWLNDPSHRGKTLAGDLRSIEKQPKAISKGINKVDCIKLQCNFGYMVKQLKDSPESEWENKAKAVLEHHFDNHDFCGSWCKRKTKSAEDRDAERRLPGKFYRCKVRDCVQYVLLKSIIDKYTSLDKLKEVAHGFSTQLNESLNNTVAWYAQKNKTLSGSKSLSTRVHLAVGIILVGYEPYLTELLKRMDVPLTEGTMKHFQRMWTAKRKMSAKHKDKEFKKRRHEKKKGKLEAEIKNAENKRRKQGWYKPGEGFNLCLPLVDPNSKLCRAGCGGTNHKTSQSKLCPMNLANKRAAAEASKEDSQKEIADIMSQNNNI
jgi:hypothetical protein